MFTIHYPQPKNNSHTNVKRIKNKTKTTYNNYKKLLCIMRRNKIKNDKRHAKEQFLIFFVLLFFKQNIQNKKTAFCDGPMKRAVRKRYIRQDTTWAEFFKIDVKLY